MNLNQLIIDNLTPLNIPVCFHKYEGDKSTYITFFIYNEKGELWADNDEKQTSFYIQIDVWSKGNYSTLVDNVLILMKDAGFKRTYAIDLFDKESNIYHKSIRFNYTREVAENE